MLYYFILIFNLLIDSCFSTHVIVQCINWIIYFTKITAFHNGYQYVTNRVCSVNAS